MDDPYTIAFRTPKILASGSLRSAGFRITGHDLCVTYGYQGSQLTPVSLHMGEIYITVTRETRIGFAHQYLSWFSSAKKPYIF